MLTPYSFHATNSTLSLPHPPTQVQDSAVQLEARALHLRETIQSLWERLEVAQTERTTFNQAYAGYKPKIIKAVSPPCITYL